MSSSNPSSPSLEFHPLTKERWADFEDLFGARGAYGGCWCMWWRLTRREFEEGQGEGNREAMHSIVSGGEVPGILAYEGGNAVGRCSGFGVDKVVDWESYVPSRQIHNSY